MTENGHQQINWRSRIVSSGKIRASQVTPHPNNPRRHPQAQREAVAASFDELGQIARIVINVNNGYLVDGEERSWLALAQADDVELDVDYVDLTEAEHLKALAYFDATTNMAYYDSERLDELLKQVNTDSPALQEMLAGLQTANEKLVYGATERGETPDERLDIFLNATIKQIVLYFNNDEFENVIERLAVILRANSFKNHTEVFLRLLEHYEATAL